MRVLNRCRGWTLKLIRSLRIKWYYEITIREWVFSFFPPRLFHVETVRVNISYYVTAEYSLDQMVILLNRTSFITNWGNEFVVRDLPYEAAPRRQY